MSFGLHNGLSPLTGTQFAARDRPVFVDIRTPRSSSVRTLLKSSLFVLVVAIGSMAAHADTLDPRIIIRDPLGCPSNSCTPVGLNFTFNVPQGGFGLLHFINVSGVTMNSLILTETGVAAANVSCSADIFSCSVVPFGQNGAKLVLAALTPGAGILNGSSFEVILSCVNQTCWPSNLQFTATANTVPEPGTMALMLTGLGAMITRRRLRAKSAA